MNITYTLSLSIKSLKVLAINLFNQNGAVLFSSPSLPKANPCNLIKSSVACLVASDRNIEIEASNSRAKRSFHVVVVVVI